MTSPASPLSVERLAELREQAEQSIASQGEYPDSCHLIAHSFIGEEMLALWNHAAAQAEEIANHLCDEHAKQAGLFGYYDGDCLTSKGGGCVVGQLARAEVEIAKLTRERERRQKTVEHYIRQFARSEEARWEQAEQLAQMREALRQHWDALDLARRRFLALKSTLHYDKPVAETLERDARDIEILMCIDEPLVGFERWRPIPFDEWAALSAVPNEPASGRRRDER